MLGDAPEVAPVAAARLARRDADPGGQVTAALEVMGRAGGGDQGERLRIRPLPDRWRSCKAPLAFRSSHVWHYDADRKAGGAHSITAGTTALTGRGLSSNVMCNK